MTRTVAQKRAALRALHREGCFVIPNPGDAGSARMRSKGWRPRRAGSG